MQFSWQAQYFVGRAMQYFVDLAVQFSWQAQYFVGRAMQYFVDLAVQFSWQAQYFVGRAWFGRSFRIDPHTFSEGTSNWTLKACINSFELASEVCGSISVQDLECNFHGRRSTLWGGPGLVDLSV